MCGSFVQNMSNAHVDEYMNQIAKFRVYINNFQNLKLDWIFFFD